MSYYSKNVIDPVNVMCLHEHWIIPQVINLQHNFMDIFMFQPSSYMNH